METALTNPPKSTRIGETFDVTDTTANIGDGTAGESETRYYLSQDQARDSGDRVLNSIRTVSSLSAGSSSSGTVTVKAPGDMPLGEYYVLACADNGRVVSESDEANNCRSTSATVRVKAPNLRVTWVQSPPMLARAGTTIDSTETTKNTGDDSADMSYTRYYLSSNGSRDSADQELWGKRQVPELTPGATSTGAVTITIPKTTSGGVYYLFACADDKREVKESDEENNCLPSTGKIWILN